MQHYTTGQRAINARTLLSHTTGGAHTIELRCDPCSFYVTIDGVTVDYSGARQPMELRYMALIGQQEV